MRRAAVMGDNARMTTPEEPNSRMSAAPQFFFACMGVLAAWFGGMWLLWMAGVESIYAHPTPFYALFAPVLPSLKGLLPALAALGAGAWLLPRSAVGAHLLDPDSPPPDAARTRRFLAGVFVFLCLFACAAAMCRGGLHGVSQAYQREAYEYVGDIGKTSSIRALFSRWLEIHPYLSMHSKVHPPGPVALLWALSMLATRDALALSLATVLFGSLAVFPLFGWLRALFGPRAAAAGVLLYAVTPSVVLFTATSADILFTPFTLSALWLFDRALRENRPAAAAGAGAAYAAATLLKFSLLGLGAWFGLCGMALLARRAAWPALLRTAAVMLAAFLAVHGLVRLWSGFDYLAAFQAAMAQFNLDQRHLDEITPRYPGIYFRLLFNPATWFYFAGIPVSLLFLRRCCTLRGVSPNDGGGGAAALGPRATLLLLAATAVAFNFLYLARGEGERSALYLFPFLIAPAAHCLTEDRRTGVLPAALAAMAAQCLLTEAVFYTYW